MASNADVARRIGTLLLSHASVRERARRGIRKEEIGVSRRPNAPRLITILLAVGLTIVGYAVSVSEVKPVLDLLKDAGVEPTRQQGYLALLASPALLVVGSFFRGI